MVSIDCSLGRYAECHHELYEVISGINLEKNVYFYLKKKVPWANQKKNGHRDTAKAGSEKQMGSKKLFPQL